VQDLRKARAIIARSEEMHRYIPCLAGSVLCLFTCGAIAQGEPADEASTEKAPPRQTVKVDLRAQPELILLGKGETERSRIDQVTSEVPPEIAAAVKAWTGIDVPKQWIKVRFYHTPHNSRFDAMSYASDTGSYKGFIEFGGKVLQDEERHVRYKEVVNASDEKSFLVVGVIEYDNPKTQRRCQVLCELEGQKPAATKDDPYIHPAGAATWTGPLIGASRTPFSDDDVPGAKQH
jgi:hypothetical protein